MTIETTRRSFLFGLGAAVTMAALTRPAALLAATPPTHQFSVRKIWGMEFQPIDPSHMSRPVFFDIWIGDRHLHHWGISSQGTLMWRAVLEEDCLIQFGHEALRIDMQGGAGLGHALLKARDTVDEGPPVEVFESHSWPGAPVLMFPHLDNSLEARLRRQEEAKHFMSGAVDERDFDDDDDGWLDDEEPVTISTTPPFPPLLGG